MGTGNSSRLVSILTFVVILSQCAFAAEEGCEGIIARQLFTWNGDPEVAKVEAISASYAKELSRYVGSTTVLSQVRADRRSAFIAVQDEAVVGYVIYERRGSSLVIVSVAVVENLLRHGIGTDLVNKVIETARETKGIDDVYTVIAMNDAIANKFFTSLTFVSTETIPARFNDRTVSAEILKFAIRGSVQDRFARLPQLASKSNKPTILATVMSLPEGRTLEDVDSVIRESRQAMELD